MSEEEADIPIRCPQCLKYFTLKDAFRIYVGQVYCWDCCPGSESYVRSD